VSSELEKLATLLRQRNEIDREIASMIHRPAIVSHIGEYIASRVFDIELHSSAVHKFSDGVFRSGPLAGKTVNIKMYGKAEGLLDINPAGAPDYYLVLAGPRGVAWTSRGAHRPVLIENVFLFNAPAFVQEQLGRAVKLGVASSVRARDWDACEVYPRSTCSELQLSAEQRRLLALFAAPITTA
jgi:hypothetical protein